MKTTVLIFMISILTITGCDSQQAYKFTNNESVLDFYKQYSSFTDPGEYAYLYKNLTYDSRGLVKDRKPEDRLVLGCRDYAILLASILKYRGIPARVRYGHATYLIPGFHASHVICEVWNENDKCWMLVDPSTGMIDYSREKFDFSNELWLQLQKGEIDTNT